MLDDSLLIRELAMVAEGGGRTSANAGFKSGPSSAGGPETGETGEGRLFLV